MSPEDFQQFIDSASRPFLTRDFAAWNAHVVLPISRVTQQGCFTCHTTQELRREFETFCDRFEAEGVTEFRRFNPVVEVIDDNQILASYDSEILRGEELVFEPFAGSVILKRARDGSWRISSVLNAVGMNHDSLPPGHLGTHASRAEAMAIYQEVLDHVSKAINSDTPEDAEEWLAKPHVLQTDDVEMTLRTSEMVRATLIDFADNLKRMGMTDYIRIAKEAWFTDPDHIEGWHITYALNSGLNMVEPYKVDMKVARQNDQWRVTLNRSHVLNHECRIISPALLASPIRDKDTNTN